MSAFFFAAGPDIKKKLHLPLVHNIDIADIAPTVLQILGVTPNTTVDGELIRKILVR